MGGCFAAWSPGGIEPAVSAQHGPRPRPGFWPRAVCHDARVTRSGTATWTIAAEHEGTATAPSLAVASGRAINRALAMTSGAVEGLTGSSSHARR
ncbi:MAG: hypothetical protein QOI10_4300 [Solirubrobacterales bacterium]|nr:hypothetical protein [Solirubrobacterales bacterium]